MFHVKHFRAATRYNVCMAASDNLNPDQLRLFMQAKELMEVTAGHTEPGRQDYLPLADSPRLQYSKLLTAHEGAKYSTLFARRKGDDSLYRSIQKEGVQQPVRLRRYQGSDQINDGHHRIVAANDINPEMYIPVSYDS